MSWMEKLYQTYEAGVLLDLPQEQLPMPTSHTLQNAHINIVIDIDGNFKRACVLEKSQIILPATESSASRSSGEAPHPLADKLQYVAKDYEEFGGKKKAYFDGYKKQLQGWCSSEYAHQKVKAIFKYISQGNVIRDLIANNIVIVDADNILLTKWDGDNGDIPALFKVLPKEKGFLDQGSALVCWSVEKYSDPNADTWKDISIQLSWISYDTLDANKMEICFITGYEQSISTNHPAKIRHSGDKAKLISSNDASGYTYRGRFFDDMQACVIGFDVSQKAHNALRWLITRQGFRNGDQAFVSWAVSGKPIPDPLVDTWAFLESPELDEDENSSDLPEAGLDHAINLGQSFALKLKNYMAGYAAKLKPNEQIIIMGIDSATPGRMGVIYYRELFSHDFIRRLEDWHYQFSWPQRHTKEIVNVAGKKHKTNVIWPISSPVPAAIAKAAYGENVTDNLKKKVIERLIPCIIDSQPFPLDLVNSCVRKATNRVGYASDAQWLWEKNLGIACALYKGYHMRHPNVTERREYAMAIEETYQSRDYLYGRLLAIAERIEEVALSLGGENRSTTAARLMQRFADRPFETWRTIELALQPYMQRLRVSRAGFLTNQLKEMDAILTLFKHDDFSRKEMLSGEFLLGYHCQRQKLRSKTETESTDQTPLQGDTE
ncbi:type I-C CRISPR-associated protein Cas8c/Csd1 [Methylomonas sp. AM2-LC]|uniref:type I-C CRISPR-associated protein Cas8c/Csd1 n=1 Tax=Methylomonas sp. AM2-LC TaxID=3153301 RepID=UPI0032675728